ncbi:MAG TPA: hypothetical protein VGG27_13975 [Magnetospirillaceae bacterium]|jgi:hypothetical protein
MSILGIFGTVGGASSAQPAAAGSSASSGMSSKAASESNAAVQSFMNYMKETPAQRFEDSWLAAHGLTEKELNAMPADKREAILKQMAEDMKKDVQQATQKKLAQSSGGAGAAASMLSLS